MLPKLVSATDIVLYETMDTYGGGGSVHVGKPHFYLIVKSGDEAHSESIQKFFRMGVNTSSNYIFVFIDIRGERRLERDLKQLNGGARLYGEIAAAAPAFLITDGPIPKLESVKAARTLSDLGLRQGCRPHLPAHGPAFEGEAHDHHRVPAAGQPPSEFEAEHRRIWRQSQRGDH